MGGSGDDGVVGGSPWGASDGTSWGAGKGGGDPEPPRASSADLARIRERIATFLRYPPAARRSAQQGQVVLSFILRADGTVDDLSIRTSSGFAELDDAALAAVRSAKPFPPPGRDIRVITPITFRIS